MEAQNSEKCLHNFGKLSPHIADSIYVPLVYWNLSTSKLLTMEFMDGVQIDDVKGIQRMGVQPCDVSRLVTLLTLQHLITWHDPGPWYMISGIQKRAIMRSGVT